MGTFTVTLKRALELTDGTWEIGTDGISRITGGNLGLDYYPIWPGEGERDKLNGLIFDHYMNREIGMETIDLFQLATRRKMNEIMPPYVALMKTTQLALDDALKTVNLSTISNNTSDQTTNNTGTNQTTSDSDSQSRSVNSETPQTMLSPDEDYATAAVDANSQGSATSTASEDSSSDTTANLHSDSNTVGYQGSLSDLIQQYRATILNIPVSIINEMGELFMGVWDTGDSYTNNAYGYYFGRY